MSASLPPRTRARQALRALVREANLQPGDPLPAERALAARWGIARATVRAAVGEWVAEGTVRRDAGGRIRIAPRWQATAPPLLVLTVLPVGEESRLAALDLHGADDYASVASERHARRLGLDVRVLRPADIIAEGGVEALLRQPPRGVVATGPVAASGIGAEMIAAFARVVPVVVLGELPDLPGIDRIEHDHAAGCLGLVRWLVAHGRRRILPLWPLTGSPPWLAVRERGWRAGLTEAGLPVLGPIQVPATPRPLLPRAREDTFINARYLAGCLYPAFAHGQPPDTLLLLNDALVPAAANALAVLGRPAGEVWLAGYDATWDFRPFGDQPAHRPRVTVDRRIDRMAALAVETVVRRCAGGPVQGVVLEPGEVVAVQVE